TADRPALVLDAGANVDCSAKELVCFAHLGTVYSKDLLGQKNPIVGLLNIGEEDEKGNAIVKEAHQLLKQDPLLNYVGNIEGRDILTGHAKHGSIDVIVTDGFVGNIVLKFYESVARLIVRLVKRDAPEVLERSDIRGIFKILDYAEYGGAPLLGVQGVCVICHGSSTTSAVKNAIRVAVQAVEAGLSQHIGAEFAQRELTAQA
ncbi:MAG: phosphate acyltransferase, partial [Gemmatimonadota bacterium]